MGSLSDCVRIIGRGGPFAMEYGIGVDASVGLRFAESRELVAAASAAEYTSAWTPSGPITRDGFQVCGQWTAAVEGLTTGIAVIPVPVWKPASLASQAGTLSELSGGRFILGIGTGGAYSAEFRRSHGLDAVPVVAMMRDYLVTVRGLLNGETVTHEGKAIRLGGLQLIGRPLEVPIYISALGPQMLRLAGELADGVSLNWTTPVQREWCRERIAEGAEQAGRDPSEVHLMEFIRVCVDEDEEKARRAFAKAFMGYALSRAGASPEHGYLGHMTRMGFHDELVKIEAIRDGGASDDEVADAFPEDYLRQMGYYGKPSGAGAALAELSRGLDTAVVRIVSSEPGMERATLTMESCRPGLIPSG